MLKKNGTLDFFEDLEDDLTALMDIQYNFKNTNMEFYELKDKEYKLNYKYKELIFLKEYYEMIDFNGYITIGEYLSNYEGLNKEMVDLYINGDKDYANDQGIKNLHYYNSNNKLYDFDNLFARFKPTRYMYINGIPEFCDFYEDGSVNIGHYTPPSGNNEGSGYVEDKLELKCTCEWGGKLNNWLGFLIDNGVNKYFQGITKYTAEFLHNLACSLGKEVEQKYNEEMNFEDKLKDSNASFEAPFPEINN